MEQYIHNTRPLQDPEENSGLMLLYTGCRPLMNVSRRIQSLGAAYGIKVPTATQVRKIGATMVALQCGTGSTAAGLVCRQLSHSVQTEMTYYQAIVGPSHSVEAFHIMEGLRKAKCQSERPALQTASTAESEQQKKVLEKAAADQTIEIASAKPVTSPPKSPVKRRPFTKEENESVSLYFSSHIEAGDTPTSAECRDFLENHGLSRTAKNIQDKVKNIIKARKS